MGFQDHVLLDHLISDLPKKGTYNVNCLLEIMCFDDRASSEVHAVGSNWFVKESSLHCGGKASTHTMVQGHLQYNV